MEIHLVNKKYKNPSVNLVKTHHNKIEAGFLVEELKENKENEEIEWLKYYFKDQELINIVQQDERVKSLITLQAIYYLSIFKRLFISKTIMSNKVSNYK